MGRTEPWSLQKTACHSTTQSLVVLPVPLDQIEQVHCAKFLGIYLSDTLRFETHLVNLLKICSQRTYLLKLLRDQGIGLYHVQYTPNTVLGPYSRLLAKIISALYQPGGDFLLSSKLDGLRSSI